MKKYSTLLFDLDNTLLDFSKDEKEALIKTLKLCNLPYDDKTVSTYVKVNDERWKEFEKGNITKDDIKKTRFKIFCQRLSLKPQMSPLEMDTTYRSLLSEGGNLLDGALPLLKVLAENGYELYAVTNGIESTQKKRLKKSGLDKMFKEVFISEAMGFQKPMKEYFDFVFEHINEKDKSKILLIGDSLTSDILGANKAGIDSMWLNRKKENCSIEKEPLFEIFDIKEAAKYLL